MSDLDLYEEETGQDVGADWVAVAVISVAAIAGIVFWIAAALVLGPLTVLAAMVLFLVLIVALAT